MPNLLRHLRLLIPLIAISCKSLPVGKPAMPDARPLGFLLEQIDKNTVETPWMSAKAVISVESPEATTSFTSQIRLVRDSAIWINFKKLSIEAARALITRDSFFIINYLGKDYYARDIRSLEDMLSLPGSFDLLQDILLGHPVLMDTGFLSVDTDTLSYVLSSNKEAVEKKYWFDSGTFGLKKMQYSDRRAGEYIGVLQGDFSISWKGAPFPSYRLIEFTDTERIRRTAEIRFSEVEFSDPKPLRFEIPSHYQPK